ncbi:Lrp/AsnC ligand binding domain-containing protein [Glutamicibacter nicotianae]|uniref:Lrp/AsnC ligand binding domain-containing protein n=1 Tax=Glutamicibacter nicotianae TaxID=37929 RepID=UPI001CC053CA|nr:Lrp/AsnC ligand binding domain-containing protein [Glutamicibacter nicotianae]
MIPSTAVSPEVLGYGCCPLSSCTSTTLPGDIAAKLEAIPEVLEAHGLTGSADILVRVAAKDAEELFRVHGQLLHIDGVSADSARPWPSSSPTAPPPAPALAPNA